MISWEKWIQEANETLLDLIFGSIAFCLLMELFGLIFAADKLAYTLGLLFGLAVAIGISISMYRGLDACLSMDAVSAQKGMIFRSLIRYVVMFVAAWIGIRCKLISFAGVIIGLWSLKVAAHIHVYTNLYITKKIRKKGR